MKYKLVLQWPGVSVADYDRLILLEETIRDGLEDVGIVGGHDFGSGEMNIFVHTDNPQYAFKTGYRGFEEDEYTAVYPRGLKHFSVI
jgi:hypothetical protein